MDLTAIQVQALVRQAQDQYVIAFAMKQGRSLIEPITKTEVGKIFYKNIIISSKSHLASSSSSSNPNDFPSFTSFQHPSKRVCNKTKFYIKIKFLYY